MNYLQDAVDVKDMPAAQLDASLLTKLASVADRAQFIILWYDWVCTQADWFKTRQTLFLVHYTVASMGTLVHFWAAF